jgi:hypothetical protein
MGSRMSITLNARLRPLDRGARYEIPLQEILGVSMPGSRVTGAGTLLSAEREPLVSDIDLDVDGDAPIAALSGALGNEGDMQSWWKGPRETALYLYGPSAARMAELIADVLARFPLAQRCRVVPLELTLPSKS